MKIPNKVKIGGLTWTVEDSQDVTNEGNCFGSTHYRSQKIFLEKEDTTTKQKREQTLLHELMHAVWWQQGFYSRENLKGLEEEVVDALSMGLYQVLRDNNLYFNEIEENDR